MEIILLLGRVLFGGYFIYSGINHFIEAEMMAGYAKSKNVPMPKLAVLFSGAFVLLGGLGVLFWFYVRFALGLITIFLIVVSFVMHNFWTGVDPTAKMGDRLNFFKNMALLGATLMMIVLAV